MAARVPRRSFASPFVITLAVAPGCSPTPGGSNPPPATTATPTTADPTTPETTPPDGGGEGGTTPTTTPDPPAEVSWAMIKQGKECMTVRKVECPQPEPGQPMRTCNPPAPQKYDCPKWDDGSPIELDAGDRIEGQPGGKACAIYFDSGACPEGASCNPPPPRGVPCPKV